MGNKKPTPDDLTQSRSSRVAKVRLDRHDRYLAFLRLARRIRADNAHSLDKLDDVIRQGEDEKTELELGIGGFVYPRKRPVATSTTKTCTVFIDECGAHSLKAKEKFKAFALAAIVVPDDEYPMLDHKWKDWKRKYLGRAGKLVHEPDIRDGNGSFYCDRSTTKRERAIAALSRFISRQTFGAVVCVLRRDEYVKEFGIDRLDDSLPNHGYLMTIDFMAERLAMALETHFGGARARVVMESREPKEDAGVQYEFARLLTDGTSYVAASWFRKAFCPGIEFLRKTSNNTGLQIADLLARPVAEKIIDPSRTPARWPEFRGRLCDGVETGNSILGLKIVPWDEKYVDVWKS